MAVTIPEFLPDTASAGERRVFAALQQLPDEVIVYYEPVIRRRYPDFVVILPDIGVIVIEVKGIPLPWIRSISSHEISYVQAGNLQRSPHPVRQARAYMNRLMQLCGDHPCGQDLMRNGRFRFAFGHLAILTSIQRSELEAQNWSDHFTPESTLCADEFDALSGSAAQLQDVARRAIYAEIPISRIPPETASVLRTVISPTSMVDFAPQASTASADDQSVAVLDFKQEQMAREIGAGHRIIYGVPGSGKTVILLAMARLLAEAGRRVLFLCYNHKLREYIATTLRQYESIEISTFGFWATAQGAPPHNDPEVFGQGLLDRIQSGYGDAGKYDALLIDEGQDFAPVWLAGARLALKEPSDGSLVIAYDLSQNLYGVKPPVWSRVGIKAPGRTRRLKTNYRNTREIISAAWSFGIPEAVADADQPTAVALSPANCVRRGPWPQVLQTTNQAEQDERCIAIIRELLTGSTLSADDVMVLCWQRARRDAISEKLKQNQLPVTAATIHGARGLQARAVVLLGADDLQGPEGRSLLYVALTRPTDRLFVLWSHNTPHIRELKANLDEARQHDLGREQPPAT